MDNPQLHALYVRWAMHHLTTINEFLEEIDEYANSNLGELYQSVHALRAKLIKEDPAYRDAAANLMAGDPLEPYNVDHADFSALEERVAAFYGVDPGGPDVTAFHFHGHPFGKGKTSPLEGLEPGVYVIDSLSGLADILRKKIRDEFPASAGTDATKWAAEWMKSCSAIGTLDEDFMIGWFANAIEAGRTAGRNEFTDRLADLTKIKEIQCSKGNYDFNEYMRGMANGLILAEATMRNQDPVYIDAPEAEPIPGHLLPLMTALDAYFQEKRMIHPRTVGKTAKMMALRDAVLDEYGELKEKPSLTKTRTILERLHRARVVIADGEVIKSNYASIATGQYLPFCMNFDDIKAALEHVTGEEGEALSVMMKDFVEFIENKANIEESRVKVSTMAFSAEDLKRACESMTGKPIDKTDAYEARIDAGRQAPGAKGAEPSELDRLLKAGRQWIGEMHLQAKSFMPDGRTPYLGKHESEQLYKMFAAYFAQFPDAGK